MKPGTKLFTPNAPRVPLRLTDRHYYILNAVGTNKYLTGSLCAALLMPLVNPPQVHGEPTGQVIKRLMAELFNHGYLNRPKAQVLLRNQEQGSHEMIYTLATKGKEALELKDPTASDELLTHHRDATIPAMLHTLMIARFRVTLTRGLATTRQGKLTQWQAGKHLKATVTITDERGYTRAPVVPDGFFTFTLTDAAEGKNKSHGFLEADRSTMPLKRFKRKLQAYAAYHQTQGHTKQHDIKGFRVFTITPSAQRRDHLRELAATLPLAAVFWFASEKDFDPMSPDSILGPIWVTGKHSEALALLGK